MPASYVIWHGPTPYLGAAVSLTSSATVLLILGVPERAVMWLMA